MDEGLGHTPWIIAREQYFEREREKAAACRFPSLTQLLPPLQIISSKTGRAKPKRESETGREKCRTTRQREREREHGQEEENHHRGREEERVTTRRTFNTYRTRREKHSGDGEGGEGGRKEGREEE